MILITGGLGYLGSHLALDLLLKGHDVVLVDNLSHASNSRLEQLEFLTKCYIPFVRLDVRNTPVLQKVFEQYPIDYVIHAAGFKGIAEARLKPLEYYNNNIGCMMSILRALQRSSVKRLVNLSSVMVYGESGNDWQEDDAFDWYTDSPYIRAQQMIEEMLHDVYRVDDYWQILNLRLGNVIGAYPNGSFGEWMPLLPKGVLPHLLQVAGGQKEVFELAQHFDTPDQTAERDFIHIKDVVDAVYQLMIWSNTQQNFLQDFNVVTGVSQSISDLRQRVMALTAINIAVEPKLDIGQSIWEKDLARSGGSSNKLKRLLGWQPQFSTDDAILHQWHYYRHISHAASNTKH